MHGIRCQFNLLQSGRPENLDICFMIQKENETSSCAVSNIYNTAYLGDNFQRKVEFFCVKSGFLLINISPKKSSSVGFCQKVSVQIQNTQESSVHKFSLHHCCCHPNLGKSWNHPTCRWTVTFPCSHGCDITIKNTTGPPGNLSPSSWTAVRDQGEKRWSKLSSQQPAVHWNIQSRDPRIPLRRSTMPPLRG